MYWFYNGKGTLLDFHLCTKTFVLVRVSRLVCFASSHTADSGAKGIGFSKGFALSHFPSVHLRLTRSQNAAHRRESVCFVRVWRLVCLVAFHTVDPGAKGIGFSKGCALFHFPSVHVRVTRSLNAAHQCESVCF